MERYTVAVALNGDGENPLLLIPFAYTATISAFANEVKRRILRYNFDASGSDIFLRLQQEDGPILDENDILADVIGNPRTENIVVTFQTPAPRVAEHRTRHPPNADIQDMPDIEGFQVRVITPSLARSHESIAAISLLHNGAAVSGRTTLGEIKSQIAEHLGHSLADVVHDQDDLECNCAFARQINEHGVWRKIICGHYMSAKNSKQASHNCSFSEGDVRIHGSQSCSLCSRPLSDQDDDDFESMNGMCMAAVFIRTDAQCGHVLHGDCVESDSPWSCPSRCLSVPPLELRDNSYAALSMIKRFLVVHEKSKVDWVDIETTSHSSLIAGLRKAYGIDIAERKFIGYTGSIQSRSQSELYDRLPVVSICSHGRHGRSSSSVTEDNDTSFTTPNQSFLDLHTLEVPIETVNLDLTIDQMGLKDVIVSGVLNVYAVQRKVVNSTINRGSGKDAIFLNADYWNHPINQSERGMASFLSSLRLFADLINAREMDQNVQDAVLHLVNLITRFPPAMRTINILMSGKTPRPSECAALSQSTFEVLKSLVPRDLIQDDDGRVFEGSRLLFGYILDKAKQIQLRGNNTPYLQSLRTIDLKDSETMEKISSPVQTTVGLLERGYFNAVKEGGVLGWSNGKYLSEIELDNQIRRVALLSGGIVSQVTIFDVDSLNLAPGYRDSDEVDHFVERRSISDLQHFAAMCARNKFSVLPPSTLPTSEAPALTLDRQGLLAVYVGRPPCAAPGKDITIFRPTLGGEENVDVAIITQLIAPVLEKREADGTSIFDMFGGSQKRKSGAPDEIVMFCVDCSNSMNVSSDFEESNGEETSQDDSEEELSKVADVDIETGTYSIATLNEMKEMILNHESFEDILAIVRIESGLGRQVRACKILESLSMITSRELSRELTELELLRERATRRYLQDKVGQHQTKITNLKTTIAGINNHKEALCDFLIYRAMSATETDCVWNWTFGDEIPKRSKQATMDSTHIPESDFSVPDEYLCPIVQEVFQDPVRASDGFTYERSAIERWFQIRRSSPCTGLELENADLSHNGQLANQIKNWINGEDILHPPSRSSLRLLSSKRLRFSLSSEKLIDVQFFSRSGSFSRQVPLSASVNDLYGMVFRGLKGRHTRFLLHFNNTAISPSKGKISSLKLMDGSIIHINIDSPTLVGSPKKDDAMSSATSEELALVKVYRQPNDMIFSYWIPKNSTNSMTSVLFRYWRYNSEKNIRFELDDMDVWSDLNYRGDGYYNGVIQYPSDEMSTLLTLEHSMGILGKEDAYKKREDASKNDDDSRENPGTSTDYKYDEQPLVLKLLVKKHKPASPSKASKNNKKLTRLDILKQMFDAFINRVLAYNYPTHVGLITFSTTVKLLQPLTHVVEDFRHAVNDMEAMGDTALWDALALANDQLSEYSKLFPGAKRRIICLSDGVDNKSSKRAHDVGEGLFQNRIAVDSFCLGDEGHRVDNLRAISHLTGGYKFFPRSLEQAMSICELEPVLNQMERPPPVESPSGRSSYMRFHIAMQNTEPDPVTRDSFPKRKEHQNQKDRFVELAALAKRIGSTSSVASPSSSSRLSRSNMNLRSSRLLSEMKTIVANPHPRYDVFVSESNMGFWKIVMQGPPESAYSDGTFVLYLDMEDSYPAFPPKGRFLTPMFHPNINRHGRICHSILDRNWTWDTSNLTVLNTIYGLLLVPEFSDPVNMVVTLNYHWDQVEFQDEVKEHIKKHAMTSSAEWRTFLLGY